MQIVVDTNVWVEMNKDIYCNKVLSDLAWGKNILVLDVEGSIISEYFDEIPSLDKEMYYKKISIEKRITWVSGKIDNKHKEKLKELSFHEDEDHVFVGAAMNADKYIIEQSDSDYGIFPKEKYRSEEEYQQKKRVAEYMRNVMGLLVRTPEDIVKNGLV